MGNLSYIYVRVVHGWKTGGVAWGELNYLKERMHSNPDWLCLYLKCKTVINKKLDKLIGAENLKKSTRASGQAMAVLMRNNGVIDVV